jgi:hypothetical protein
VAHVVLAPPKTLNEDLLKKVASLVGKDIVDTRLRLAGKIPRIIASYPDADTADSIAQGLREAGLAAFVGRDSELRSRTAGFMAHTMRAGEKEVIFRDRRDGEVMVEAADAFLVIRGRIPSAPQKKAQTTKMKLNISATLLTGGLPVMRRVTEKTAQESFQAEGFVRIYDRKSSDPRVEMTQNHIDYSLLGPELTPSTPANFNIVLTKLREWFPLAIFDDLLIRSFKANVPAAGPEEALEINCKLIYMYHLAIERRGRP